MVKRRGGGDEGRKQTSPSVMNHKLTTVIALLEVRWCLKGILLALLVGRYLSAKGK